MTGDGPADDPVRRNRAAPRRRTPGRAPTGWDVTRRWTVVTAAVVVVATVVLLVVLAGG